MTKDSLCNSDNHCLNKRVIEWCSKRNKQLAASKNNILPNFMLKKKRLSKFTVLIKEKEKSTRMTHFFWQDSCIWWTPFATGEDLWMEVKRSTWDW